MALRDVVVGWFGENAARKIEQFVEGEIFGDVMVTCPACGRPVASAYLGERRACPVCGAAATDETANNALAARRAAVQAAADAANKEVEEIDRRLLELRSK